MLTLNDGRKELYQWDTGRTATVDIECDVVHFANLKYGESLAVEVKEGKVAIPNKLLMSGVPIYCWAFAKDENGAYTKKEQTFSVIKRAKPSDYVYTETEVISIQTAVENALEEAKESGAFKGDSGANGKDGTSVTVSSVSESTADGGQNLVTFSDGKTLTVKNGSKGSQGVQGIKGNNGTDGVSPTVEIEAITGGTKVTITDKNGTHEFNVMNGVDGAQGSQGEKGDPTDVQQTTGQSTTAVMSQKATTDEINALKDDSNDKLPKSPINWEPWTAEEQAAARERIGINNAAELVEKIELTESVVSVVRAHDTAGVAYNFKAMRIRISNTSGDNINASVWVNGIGATFSSIQRNSYAPTLLDCSSGLLNVVSTQATSSDEGARNPVMPRTRAIGHIMTSINKIEITGVLPAGTEIEIYGVKA